MHRFDQGWRELNRVEEVVSVGISVLSALCLVLFCVFGTVALYEWKLYDHGISEIVPYICGQVGPMTLYC